MLVQLLMAQITKACVKKLGAFSSGSPSVSGRAGSTGNTFRIDEARKTEFLDLICNAELGTN